MNRLLILLSALFIINACSKSNHTTDPNGSTYPPIDTIKNAAIDTIMYQMGRLWIPGPHFHAIGINEKDSIKYIDVNGYAGRISSTFVTDSTATWITAHQMNNELVLMRFREFRQKPIPNVQESISYFENGKIFYSRERNRVMTEDDQIGSFRDEPFKENFRAPAELMAEYMPYWEISKEVIAKDYEANKNN
ncbi:MAG: hypothetical protein GC192_21635 [Bacteroidetes bacterium]|nr:hypothetical protein [Bacteroidota bacterium]